MLRIVGARLADFPVRITPARIFDEGVLRRHPVARGLIGQIGNSQMHRGDRCQGLIVRIQSSGHGREPGHEPVDDDI
jgi:hypothetical protein